MSEANVTRAIKKAAMTDTTQRVATCHELTLLKLPSIAELFPFRFKDTGFELKFILFTCGSCEKPFDIANVHGTCSQVIESVIDLDLVAKCIRCDMITPFQLRISSDRYCNWKDHKGVWNQFRIYEPGRKGVTDAWHDMLGVIKKLGTPN